MTAPATLPRPIRTLGNAVTRTSEAPPAPSTAHLPAFAADFPARRAEAIRRIAATELPTYGDGIRGRVRPRIHPADR